MKNLAEALLEQQKRVREEVLPQYEALRGKPGVNVSFAIYGIKCSLSNAERAAMSGDIIEITRAYEDLKGIQ